LRVREKMREIKKMTPQQKIEFAEIQKLVKKKVRSD